MKKFYILISFIALTIGCHSGPSGEVNLQCNKDGSCNSDKLSCERNFNAFGPGFICAPKKEPEVCSGEATCFCYTCNKNCAKGVKICSFSDTTTWGAKPAVCECN